MSGRPQPGDPDFPYMLADTPEEFERVRRAAWPAPSPAAAGLPAEDVERVARAIVAEAYDARTWVELDASARAAFSRYARAALAEMRPTAEAACGHLSPALHVGEGQPLAPLMCELPYGHGGAHEARNGDLPPTRWAAVQPSPADGVDPAEIVRQRALGWPDFHPEDFCHQCGRRNPCWFADTAEWQAATGSTGDGGGILCPSCFAALYRRATGRDAIIWRLSIDPRSRDLAPVPDDADGGERR